MARERLQKVLASQGVASRRAAERLIEAGRVTVNSRIAAIGESADPEHDDIRVDGRLLTGARANRYVALHKPEGYVTSTVSERGELTVMDLVDAPGRIYPVGRLDVDTAGLLLMTDDGAWANLVTHPRYQIEKEYVALVSGHPTAAQVESLRAGLQLPTGEVTSPAQVTPIHRAEGTTTLRIVVREGKKRQIRLMMAAVGHPVVQLTRVRVGSIRLGELARGKWRELTETEVNAIRAAAAVRVTPVE